MTNLNDLKQIPGYAGYFADRLGNIFSNRISSLNRQGVIKKMNPATGKLGYNRLLIYSYKKRENKPVHRLIALTFLGENKLPINHINGIKTDNRVENLEYCTNKENMQHAVNTGLKISTKGESHGMVKLSEVDVIAIRLWLDNKLIEGKDLAKKFGVSKAAISNIYKRKVWKHIDKIMMRK